MADYQLTGTDVVIRTGDGCRIPNDPFNWSRAQYDAWSAVAGNVADPYVPPPVDLAAYAAAARWAKETGGIAVAGVPVATDDRSKLMIIGARVAASANPSWSTIWQGADGNTYPIDVTAMIAISDAVAAHVAACFAAFSTVLAGIKAGTVTTTAQIDAAFA